MKNVLSIVMLLLAGGLPATARTQSAIPDNYRHQSVQKDPVIVENKGQVSDQNHQPRPDVLYYGKSSGLEYFLTRSGISYQLRKVVERQGQDGELPENDSKAANKSITKTIAYQISRVDVKWVGANSSSVVSTGARQQQYQNFYLPHCQAGIKNAGAFESVTYAGLYDNIDIKYYLNTDAALEYDLVVQPGGDYKKIVFEIEGATGMRKESDGSILIETAIGTIRQGKPVVMQNGRQIAAEWLMAGTQLSYKIDQYDHSQPLVIDPIVRAWGSYFGNDDGSSAAISMDPAGNVFVAGITFSTSGIATTGAYLTSYVDSGDVFLAKFNSFGSLLWATYYGGVSTEGASGCRADASGDVYITGETYSPTGLATSGAYQMECDSCRHILNANPDVFIAKFSTTGALLWGTYYGGVQAEHLGDCSVDPSGNVYVSGTTASVTGIATPGAHLTTCASCVSGTGAPIGSNAFLVKFNAAGALQWGTYFGNSDELGDGCATDAAGNVFLTGRAYSPSGIATPGAYQVARNGAYDAFLAKFSSAGSLSWATYFGGPGYESGFCSTDGAGNVFLSGTTSSASGIATAGAHQVTCYSCLLGNNSQVYLAKFNAAGARLWSTYYGGDKAQSSYACVTDLSGNIVITGATSSDFGIATAGAYQSYCDSCSQGVPVSKDAFIALFNPSGVLNWGTYYGGSGTRDLIAGAVVNAAGDLYVTGTTNSLADMATAGSYDVNCDLCNPGKSEPFIARFAYTLTEIEQVSSAGSGIVVYPNPTNDEIMIRGGLFSRVGVTDITGSVVKLVANTDRISLRDLSPGIYFVQLYDGFGAVLKREKVTKL